MSVLVKTERLHKEFGDITAVDDISLSVGKGEVLGFLGPNGAGKSTTMKLITGFLEPDAGSAEVCGHDVVGNPRAAKAVLGYLPEGAPLYGDMTARSFLGFIAGIRGFDNGERTSKVEAAVDKMGLGSVLDQSIETLSKGFKRRVGLAQAILHDPDVLILDEPTDGLDPNQKHQVRSLIREMASDKAIIISTHILEEVEAVCTRAVVIDKGRIVANGTARELQARLPYHNAVAIRVDPDMAGAVREALGGLSGVEKVETADKQNGSVLLRALPKDGTQIAAAVAAVIREKTLSIQELFVEHGRLDDVFRQITSSDKGAGHA